MNFSTPRPKRPRSQGCFKELVIEDIKERKHKKKNERKKERERKREGGRKRERERKRKKQRKMISIALMNSFTNLGARHQLQNVGLTS